MKFFCGLSLILALISWLFFIPVLITYFQTGLVPRFPTFILSAFIMLAAMLSLVCGLVLHTTAVNARKNFEIQMNIITMILKSRKDSEKDG